MRLVFSTLFKANLGADFMALGMEENFHHDLKFSWVCLGNGH